MSFKRFIKVFTYLGAVFLMSYIIFNNAASAITPVIDVSGYEVISNQRTPYIKCFYSDNSTANSAYCEGSNNKQVTGFDFSPSGQQAFKKGDVVDFYVAVGSSSFLDTYTNTGVFRFASNQFVFQLVDFKEVSSNSIPHFSFDNVQYLSTGSTALHIYNFTFTVIADYTGYLGINSTSNVPFLNFLGYSSSSDYFVVINNVTIWRGTGASSSDQQNEINATNEAVDNSESSGDQASTDANTATSSLLSVIGGFVSVITNATPSNCVIDAPLNTAFSNDRFNVDLCSLSLPNGIGALTSIIAIMIIVPFCISMFNKFIGIISGFQQ